MVSKKDIEEIYKKIEWQRRAIQDLESNLGVLSRRLGASLEDTIAKKMTSLLETKMEKLELALDELAQDYTEKHSEEMEKRVREIYKEVVSAQPLTIALKEQIFEYVRSLYDGRIVQIDNRTDRAIAKIDECERKASLTMEKELEAYKADLKKVAIDETIAHPEKYSDIFIKIFKERIETELEEIAKKAIEAKPEIYVKEILKQSEEFLQKAAQEKVEKIFSDKVMTALQAVIGKILTEQAKEYLENGSDKTIGDITLKIIKGLSDQIQEKVVAEIASSQGEQTEGEYDDPDDDAPISKTHHDFGKLLACLRAGTMPMLVGPAGTGKSTAVEQAAKALHLKFYTANRVQNAFELTGYKDATGAYQPTQFYQAYKNGGVFFLDEVDASSPDALVTINTAMAQGYMAFPNGRVNMHPNFRLVAAGNTYGLGADIQYVGRNQLDAATLDRFTVIRWDYDRELEKEIIENKELREFGWALRKYVEKAGIHIIISTRGLLATQKLLGQSSEISVEDNIEMNLLEGLDASTLKKIYNGILPMLSGRNRFLLALKNLYGYKELEESENE